MQPDEEIKKELQQRGIQLWKPPYYGVRECSEALQRLSLSTFVEREDAIVQLQYYRDHALQKLRAKNKLLEELRIQILGANAEVDLSQDCKSWAEETELSSKNCIVLRHVNPELSVSIFSDQLTSLLQVGGVRLVHKGKTLLPDGAHLNQCLTGTVKVLCLVKAAPAGKSTEKTQQVDEDQQLIEAIRRSSGNFVEQLDITDGSGSLVSMTQVERRALLAALGLHAFGKERMSTDRNKALLFLLQADEEWNQMNDSSWRTRVDNYGLLQLDICWIYLQLESIENLPQVLERLAQAERVLRHQVHTNFVTLAIVQADMENPVPPLSAMFVRLFLLQGVAYHHAGKPSESRERLDWAWGLAKNLRAVSLPEAVARLVEAVHVTPFQAISALRHKNGNIDQAAALIEKDLLEAEEAAEKRSLQRKYGLCQNGTSYVDLALMEQLQTVLNLGGTRNSDSELVVSSLLRLSDNTLERAIDIYQDCLRDSMAVFRRTIDLDRSQGVASRAHQYLRKRSREDYVVDNMALVSLVSLGVEKTIAERALVANGNNSEQALLWLTSEEANSAGGSSAVSAPVATGEAARLLVPEQQTADSIDVRAAEIDGNNNSQSSSVENNKDGFGGGSRVEESAESQAARLLEQVLGDVLQKQDRGEGYLGNSLEEEWEFIEKYRGSE